MSMSKHLKYMLIDWTRKKDPIYKKLTLNMKTQTR